MRTSRSQQTDTPLSGFLSLSSLCKPMAREQKTERDGVFQGDDDHYKGVQLTPRHYGSPTASEFEIKLKASLEHWKEEGKRGVWIKIPLTQSELIPPAAKLGFQFHHAHPDHVMMAQWLPSNEPNNLPGFAYHYIGVAGFVVNDKNEVLLVKEKWLRRLSSKHWKLPGGHTDGGEELWETAIRETWEETGVKTEFVAMLCFRHMHGYRWGTDDIYFACLLRPLTTEIIVNPAEIDAAKWMNVDEYIADPETSATNRLIAQCYKDGLANGSFIQPHTYPGFLSNQRNLVLYRNHPWSRRNDSQGQGGGNTRTEGKLEPHTKL